MLITEEIKKMVEDKYDEMVGRNESSAILDEEKLGELRVFIGIEPSFCMMSFEIDGKNVYVGSNTVEAL